MTSHENDDAHPVAIEVSEEGADHGEAEAARRREVLRKAGAWAAAAPIMLALFDPTRANADCDECDLSPF